MKRNLLSTITLCVVLGLVLAATGCESHHHTKYGWVQVVNSSSYTIGYLYISPSSSSDWGPDQLGSYVIDPGETFTVYDIEVGSYDIMVQDLDHGELASTYGEYVGTTGLVWTLSD